MKRTESMELLKTTGDLEIRRLKQRVQEQEALLTEKQARVEQLEGEVETQNKTIDDLNFQKSQLEHDVTQYCTKLEIALKDKMATEQELKRAKLQIEQTEATWSLTQKKLEDLLKKETDGQVKTTERHQRIISVEEEEDGFTAEEEFHNQLQAKNSLSVGLNGQSTKDSQLESSLAHMQDVLQQKQEELVIVQKKVEMAEEKAQSYKKLLDDSNNRLKKLQMDMDSERMQFRQKSDDLLQETINTKKSMSELQEEIRSLQRAKSSLEQSAFFQSTEVDGLKEQLKFTQGELQKKSSSEQENSYKVNNLEEEVTSKQAIIDQLKYKCNELTRMNVSSDSEIRSLQIQMESLEKERSLSEQKIRSLKSDLENWKQQLQTSNEENATTKRSEQSLKLKCKNLEGELQKSDLVATQLQRKNDELKKMNLELEQNLKNVRAKLDQVSMEIESKDQQIKILKSQVEGAKSQVRIIEDELNKRSHTTHELQLKLQDYSDDAKKISELQQKIKSLNSNIVNYEHEIASLKSEVSSLLLEKNAANQKVHLQKAEINDLNEMLKNKNAELQKQSNESQKLLGKVNMLEDELFSHKNSLKGLCNNSEKGAEKLKKEILTLQNDKIVADRNAESLNIKLSELSFSLQRSKDELARETQERKSKEFKIQQLETELQKTTLAVKELTSCSENSRSNLQHENIILKKEKSEMLEKNTLFGSEVKTLKEKLQRAQADTEQKQRENAALQLKSQQMEQQLDKCKIMLEELKSKLELQKEAYEKQLWLMQTEMEKKLTLLQSEITREGKPSSGAELSLMQNKYFKQDVHLTKTVHQTTVESKQVDQELQMKQEKLQEEKAKLAQDLSKAKSEIAQLENEKLQLGSKMTALQSFCNQQTIEIKKFEKIVADNEHKLTIKENEVRVLREQIEFYAREVRSLQEALSSVNVEGLKGYQNVTNTKAEAMNSGVVTTKKTAPVNIATKSIVEDETLKIKKV